MIQFAYTILYVQDVAETIAFYEKAFGFQKKFIGDNGEYGEMVTGETTLSFASFDMLQAVARDGAVKSEVYGLPLGVEIAFSTTDVEEIYYKAMEAGASSVREAEFKPWGQTVAYVRDINGFLIEICTPMPS